MALTKRLSKNNIRSSLAGAISAVATTMTVQSGVGATLPNPNNAIGEYFDFTIQDQATGLRVEIVAVTAVVGDVLTIVRGQQTTTGQAWNAGDACFLAVTAGAYDAWVQPTQVQSGQFTYTDAAGTTTAYTASLAPAIAALTEGMTISVDTAAVGTNTTTTPTISLNGLTAYTITLNGGTALRVGDIPKFAQLQYNLATTQWVLLNPVYGLSPGYLAVTTTSAITAASAGKIIAVNGGVTVTLPALSTMPVGVPFRFISGTTGHVIVSRAGSDTFSISGGGTTSTTFETGGYCDVYSDGTNWRVESSREPFNRAVKSGGSGDVMFLPNNMVLQFGLVTTNASGYAIITFPLTFDVFVRGYVNPVGGNYTVGSVISSSNSAFTHVIAVANTLAAAPAGVAVGWQALGYIGV
jgi:hypothetical protein